jgi:hypothetical protein
MKAEGIFPACWRAFRLAFSIALRSDLAGINREKEWRRGSLEWQSQRTHCAGLNVEKVLYKNVVFLCGMWVGKRS